MVYHGERDDKELYFAEEMRHAELKPRISRKTIENVPISCVPNRQRCFCSLHASFLKLCLQR